MKDRTPEEFNAYMKLKGNMEISGQSEHNTRVSKAFRTYRLDFYRYFGGFFSYRVYLAFQMSQSNEYV